MRNCEERSDDLCKHIILTCRFAPRTSSSAPGYARRSVSHWLGSSFAEDSVTGAVPKNNVWPVRDSYSAPEVFGLYGASKLQNVMFAFGLQRRLPESTVVLFTPGFCSTKIGNSDRQEGKFNVMDYIPLADTAKQGGDMLLAATKVRHHEERSNELGIRRLRSK